MQTSLSTHRALFLGLGLLLSAVLLRPARA